MKPKEDIDERFYALWFGVNRSVRYHGRRVRFCDVAQQLMLFVVVLFGLATVTAFGSALATDWPEWLKLLPSMLASVLAALSLAFGWAHKARLHEQLRRDFVALEKWMEQGRAEPTEELLVAWKSRRLEIEAGEPPVLRVLDTMCHNDLMRAEGHPHKDQIKIGFFQRLFAHFFDLRQYTLHADNP